MKNFFVKKDKPTEIHGGMVLKDPDGKRWIVIFSHDKYFVLASEPFAKGGCMLRHYRAHVNRDGLMITDSSDCFYTKDHLVRLVSEGGWTTAEESEKFGRKDLEKRVRDYLRMEEKLHNVIKELKIIRDETNDLKLKAKLDIFLDVTCWQELQMMRIDQNE